MSMPFLQLLARGLLSVQWKRIAMMFLCTCPLHFLCQCYELNGNPPNYGRFLPPAREAGSYTRSGSRTQRVEMSSKMDSRRPVVRCRRFFVCRDFRVGQRLLERHGQQVRIPDRRIALGKDYRALDGVFQFPDVAGPGVDLQPLQRLRV